MPQRREIHLVNPLWNAAGGSENRTIELFRELTPHAHVDLWTDKQPDPDLARLYPIQRIDPATGSFPRGGTLVYIGIYQSPGTWVAAAQPRRTIVVYNTRAPHVLVPFMKQLFDQNVKSVEVVYASELLRQQTKLRGVVEPSFIDLNRFAPLPADATRAARPFVVGRLSRNDPLKHHPDDLLVYQRLIDAGCRVRIMGGTCLASQCVPDSRIELLPAKVETAEGFLHSLDCFFYRTGPQCWETFCRVIHEAMACGLPVVCHCSGGYITTIDHGRNGFLFDTNDEALAIIHRLQGDRALRESIGSAARASVEGMFSPAERAKVIEYYLA